MTSSVIRYGELPDVPVGSVFPSRRALRDAGVHRPLQAGIDFAPGQAASSVVLSGVYPDDDQGDVVIYTGQGGLQPGTSRVAETVQRIVRDTAVTREVKRIYDYTCQICRIALPTPVAPYAEAAHIRPIGRPHNGREAMDNVLCLCPNDHVLFDFGAITVLPESLTVTGDRATEGQQLFMARRHRLDLLNFDYHREANFVPIVDRPDR